MDYFHIWNFPCGVSVKVKRSFLERIRKALRAKYGGWRQVHAQLFREASFSTFKDMFKPSLKNYRSSKMLLLACADLGIPYTKLEKSILAYRTTRGRVEIAKARLPIKVSPLFSMLIAHIFGDGCCVKIKGRELIMNYRQYDPVLLSNFIKKTEAVFGRLKYAREYFYAAKRFYLPSACSVALADYYGLGSRDFLSHTATVPRSLFLKPKMHLVAFLVAFIIDEAMIDSSLIVIVLCNRNLILGLGRICEALGYEHTIRGRKLYILAEGVRRFWKDYLSLKKTYPEVDMGYREEAIREFIIRGRKKLRSSGKGQNRNEIVSLLAEKNRTISALSRLLLMTRQGVKFHIKRLQSDGVVKAVGKGRAGAFIYALKRRFRYPTSRRGESGQLGATRKKILMLLTKRPRTVPELSKHLKIDPAAVRNALKKLESDGKIEIYKKIIPKTHPAYEWSLTECKT